MLVPESCALNRDVQREALTGVPIRQRLSRDRTLNLDVDGFQAVTTLGAGADGIMVRYAELRKH